jgi:hypothetical protein
MPRSSNSFQGRFQSASGRHFGGTQFELVGASVYYLNELEFNQRIDPRRIMLQRYMYLDLTEHGFAAFVRTYRTHVFDYIPMIPSVT